MKPNWPIDSVYYDCEVSLMESVYSRRVRLIEPDPTRLFEPVRFELCNRGFSFDATVGLVSMKPNWPIVSVYYD